MIFTSTAFDPEKIVFIPSALKHLRAFLEGRNCAPEDIFVLTDENTANFCLPELPDLVHDVPREQLIKIPAGEKSKSLRNAEKIYRLLMERAATRQSLLVNLGGGVITDLGGFVASTFKRGVSFVHIPTSLMGQVDAAIGGKTAVNLDGIKNQLGTFSFPEQVLIYTGFLKTLPEEELLSGFAEVIKHALIADRSYLEYLLEQDLHNPGTDWETIVKRSVEIKSDIVLQDPYDFGVRRKLNFGHTFGHAIETCMQRKGGSVSHGQAVAAGMICESHLAYLKNMISFTDFGFILSSIQKFIRKIIIEADDFDVIFDLMRSDKKNERERINFSLPDRIGNVRINCEAKPPEILECLSFYKTL